MPILSIKPEVNNSVLAVWKSFWRERHFKTQFVVTVLVFIIVMNIFSHFLAFVESRAGVLLDDPLLKLFNPRDVTWLSFSLIYFGIFTALYFLKNNPQQLLITIQSYSLLVLFRIVAMYLIPLDPPSTMIILHDPFVEIFANSLTPTKDLFFSGHTSMMFLLFLTATSDRLKICFLLGTALIASFVIIQHVHYSIDVLAAPFFAYTSYRIVVLAHQNFFIRFQEKISTLSE